MKLLRVRRDINTTSRKPLSPCVRRQPKETSTVRTIVQRTVAHLRMHSAS